MLPLNRGRGATVLDEYGCALLLIRLTLSRKLRRRTTTSLRMAYEPQYDAEACRRQEAVVLRVGDLPDL